MPRVPLITDADIDRLIIGQQKNARLYKRTLGGTIVVSVVLFLYLASRGLLKEIGPAFGNLLTFVSGILPMKEIAACNDRITGLNATAAMIKQATPGTQQAEEVETLVLDTIKRFLSR